MAIPNGIFSADLFPGTDFNKVNLDWICDELKKQQREIDELRDTVIDYDDLIDKPSIGGVTLQGNKTLSELGYTIDSALSLSSSNPVENGVITGAINTINRNLSYANINTALTEYLKQFLIFSCSHTGTGTFNLTGLSRTTMAKRCCLPVDITINALNGHKVGVQTFQANGSFINGGPWVTSAAVPKNTYFQFIIDTNTNNDDLFNVVVTEDVDNLHVLNEALSLYNASLTTPPLIKQELTPLTILNISPQSFDYDKANNRLLCYGNSTYFYSYDLSTGQSTTLSNAMDCGHGNSCCYDAVNKNLYVFEWDTPYITPINMTGTPVKGTSINTGLTGYLAGAIDFDTMTAYIFQRDSYPDTEDYYNFIVFDISSNTVKSNTKTKIKMESVQDCKYKDGYIFCNWGSSISHLSAFDTFGSCIYTFENITQSYGEGEALAFVDDTIFVSSFKGSMLQTFKFINAKSLFS